MARWKQAQGSDSLPTGLEKNLKIDFGKSSVSQVIWYQHKTQTKSFKNRKLVAAPKEDWIVVKNTHEAIIDEETFELVQKCIGVKEKEPNKTGRPNMFVGLVKMPGLWTQYGVLQSKRERAEISLQDICQKQQPLHNSCNFL